MRKGQKLLLTTALVVSFGIFAGCGGASSNPVSTESTSEESNIRFDSTGLNEVQYVEEMGKGDYKVYLYRVEDNNAELCVTEVDGTEIRYSVDTKIYGDLRKVLDDHNMLDWTNLGKDEVVSGTGDPITVKAVVVARPFTMTTDRMPEGGDKYLTELKDIMLSYATEENVIREFTVTIKGKEYATTPGTGQADGTGAIIEFGDEKWWVLENFVGYYELTDESREMMDVVFADNSKHFDNVSLEISKDGTVHFVADELISDGRTDSRRMYKKDASALSGILNFDFYEGNENLLKVFYNGTNSADVSDDIYFMLARK